MANMANNAVFLCFIGLKLSDKVSYIYNKGDEIIENLFFDKFFLLDIQLDSGY